MSRNDEKQAATPGNGTLLSQLENAWCRSEREDEEDLDPGPICEELWDVFALDEETAEPEPEPGDFWGEVDDEELI